MTTWPDYSIVTPVYHEESGINRWLRSILQTERIERAEIILVDGGNGSTIEALDPEHRNRVASVITHPGRGHQLDVGAGVARGAILVFLHADTRLPPHALKLISAAVERAPAGAFGISIETTHPAIRLIGRVANLRNRMNRTPYGDQVHFFLRDYYREIGGYRPLPIMEDVEIMRRIKVRGDRPVLIDCKVASEDRRWRKEGIVRTTLRNWSILILFRCGVPAGRLVRFYRPHR